MKKFFIPVIFLFILAAGFVFAIGANAALLIPQPGVPQNNAKMSTSPYLGWGLEGTFEQVSEVNLYQYKLWNIATPSQIMSGTTKSRADIGDIGDGTYQWQVRGCNDIVSDTTCSGWSDVYIFTKDSAAYLPNLIIEDIKIDPPNVTVDKKATLSFVITNNGQGDVANKDILWSVKLDHPINSVYNYSLKVAGVPSCSKYLPIGSSCVANYEFTYPIVRTTTFTIIVDPENLIKELNENDNAPLKSFNVYEAQQTNQADILPPILISPINNSSVSSEYAQLSWQSVDGAGYHVQYGLNSSSTSISPFQWELSTIYNKAKTINLSRGAYIWRVRSCKEIVTDSTCGAWSKTESFTISAPSMPIYKLIKPVGDIVRGKKYTFITEISNAVPDAPIFIYLQRPDGSMKYDGLNIVKKSDQAGYWKGDDVGRFITVEGQNGTWISWISVAGVVSNKLYHNVVGSETQISQETINIKGRLIDKTTSLPIKGVAIYTGDGGGGRATSPIYTGNNGEFNISTDKNFSIAKMFPFWPSCYIQGFISLQKIYNGKLVASFDVDLFNTVSDIKIDVIGNNVDLGDISLWPAVDINIVSDIPVKFGIIRAGNIGGGNENYKTSHTTSNVIPLNYDTAIELLDEYGIKHLSPTINLPLSNGCKPAVLSFLNKQFYWDKIPEGSLLKSPSDPTVYVIKDGKKQPISSPQEFEQSGYKWDQIKTVQLDLLKQIADLKAQISQLREELKKTGTLIKNPTGPEVYVIKDGKKEHIASPQEFAQKGYKWDQIKTVTSDEISQIPDYIPGQKEEGIYPNGTLIKAENDSTVYIIVNGKKRPIPDPATFNNWGLKWDQIKEVPASQTREFEDIKVSSDIVRAQGNDKIYRIIGDKKLWIPTVQAFLGSGYKPNSEIDISQDDIADFEDVKYIKVKGGRYVYEIKGDKKYRITNTGQIPAQDIKPVTLAEFTAYPIGK